LDTYRTSTSAVSVESFLVLLLFLSSLQLQTFLLPTFPVAFHFILPCDTYFTFGLYHFDLPLTYLLPSSLWVLQVGPHLL